MFKLVLIMYMDIKVFNNYHIYNINEKGVYILFMYIV